MKKSSLILLSCIWASICKAQQNDCLIVRDTFCFVTLDIRGSGVNPTLMNGVTVKNIFENLKKDNADSLLSSFYGNAYYVPDLSSGLNKMIITCMKDSSGYKYLKDHALELAQLAGRIKSNSRSKKFELRSGETVFFPSQR